MYPVSEAVWRCECGGHLNSEGAEHLHREDVIADRFSLWRYEKALPLSLAEATTDFQEGLTPLVGSIWGGRDVRLKLDYMMPTGSFKDRGTSIVVNYMKKLGIDYVLEDSSGNAGASIAAYAAAAGLKCDVYVPASASAGKLFQIGMYGARLVKIAGSRLDVAHAALEAAKSAFYASHNWHPLFLEGTKTLAYELWEQLGWQAPDSVIVPLGMGSALLGMYKGFRELAEAGEIDRMPRLFGVQAASCAPLYTLLTYGHPEVSTWPTIAEGIACADPIRGPEVVHAIKSTGGNIEIADEEEIVDAVTEAARLGFCIEPTSAAALAGAARLFRSGACAPGGTTVVVLTGNGLKSMDKIIGAVAGGGIRT